MRSRQIQALAYLQAPGVHARIGAKDGAGLEAVLGGNRSDGFPFFDYMNPGMGWARKLGGGWSLGRQADRFGARLPEIGPGRRLVLQSGQLLFERNVFRR
jgi:hypothetical protein